MCSIRGQALSPACGSVKQRITTLQVQNLHVREASADDAVLIADLTRACWAERVTASSSGHHELQLAVHADQTRVVDLYAVFEFELTPELEYTRANPLEEPPLVMRRWLKRKHS